MAGMSFLSFIATGVTLILILILCGRGEEKVQATQQCEMLSQNASWTRPRQAFAGT
jgi:hypothetical protein